MSPIDSEIMHEVPPMDQDLIPELLQQRAQIARDNVERATADLQSETDESRKTILQHRLEERQRELAEAEEKLENAESDIEIAA